MGPEKVGFLTYAVDIAPACDCVPGSDRPIIPNLGVLASRDMVAIDMGALDMSVKASGIPGSAAEEKFTAIVGMSQWITPNACSLLGAGSKEYWLVTPQPSTREEGFAHPMFTPEKTAGYYLSKLLEKGDPWTPPGGYKYHDKPRVPIEELGKR